MPRLIFRDNNFSLLRRLFADRLARTFFLLSRGRWKADENRTCKNFNGVLSRSRRANSLRSTSPVSLPSFVSLPFDLRAPSFFQSFFHYLATSFSRDSSPSETRNSIRHPSELVKCKISQPFERTRRTPLLSPKEISKGENSLFTVIPLTIKISGEWGTTNTFLVEFLVGQKNFNRT